MNPIHMPSWAGFVALRIMRARFLAALPFLLLSGCLTASHPPAAPVAKITFELVGNHLFLPVRVNGAGPFTFVLDTGIGVSMVDERLASTLKLKHWPFSMR